MLDEKNIYLDVEANTKEELISFICDHAYEQRITRDRDGLYQDFLNREEEFPTGLQDGFAIPHARSERVDQIAIMLFKSEKWYRVGNFRRPSSSLYFCIIGSCSS